MKSAAEINAERIAEIIRDVWAEPTRWDINVYLRTARKIVEAFPELRAGPEKSE